MDKLIIYPRDLPTELTGSVVVIGNFDGVHAGHQSLISHAIEMAKGFETPRPVLALTFDPHPRQVLFPEMNLISMMTLEQKVAALRRAGVDNVAMIAFNLEFATWTPAMFIERILVDWLKVVGVCVGENFHFGTNASGSGETLLAYHGFKTKIVQMLRDDKGQVISSRRLRLEGLRSGV